MRTRRLLVVALAILAVGCGDGGGDSLPDDGPTLAVRNGNVRIRCFGGDCFGGVVVDSGGIWVGITRTVDGVAETRSEIVPRVVDVDVEMGDGRDSFQIVDYYVQGTLRIAMGGGDDFVDLCDGAALGTTRVNMGEGDDQLSFGSSLPAQRFFLDAGPGDDGVALNHVPYPNANVVRGGEGTDSLSADADTVERAEIDGFEEEVLL